MHCPKCQSENKVKNGIIKNMQRYRCNDCGCCYTRLDRHGKPLKQKIMAVSLHLCGMSMNSIAEFMGVTAQSVMRWVRWAAETFAPIPEVSKEVTVLEMDEMHHFLLKKNQKLWIWKVLDHQSRSLCAWEFGSRDTSTGQKALEKAWHFGINGIYADSFPAYPEIAGSVPLVQSKSHTYQIEQNNAQQRHWLASFHRRSQVVTRSTVMLQARMQLFARFRVNGSIQELFSIFRSSLSMLK